MKKCNNCQTRATCQLACYHYFCGDCNDIMLNIIQQCAICQSYPIQVPFNEQKIEQKSIKYKDAQEMIQHLTNKYFRIEGILTYNKQYGYNLQLGNDVKINQNCIYNQKTILKELKDKKQIYIVHNDVVKSNQVELGAVFNNKIYIGKNTWADYYTFKSNMLINYNSAQFDPTLHQVQEDNYHDLNLLIQKLQFTYQSSINTTKDTKIYDTSTQKYSKNQQLQPLLNIIEDNNELCLVISQLKNQLIILKTNKVFKSINAENIAILHQYSAQIIFPLIFQKITNFTPVIVNMTESTSLTSQLNMLQNYSLFVVSSNDNIYQIARLDTASFQFHEQLVCFTFKINLGMLLFDVKFSIVTVENYTENMFVCANFRYLGTGKQFGKLTGKIGSFAVVKWTSIFIEMVQIGDLSCSELSYI